MDLHRLRCAVAIAEHGSFSEAAVHLDISQPTISHAIARLEEELGVRLFDRTPTGTRPTAIGERVLGPARRALLEADNVRAEVAAATGILTGELRLAGIRTAVHELVGLAAGFRRAHPEVRLVLGDPGGDGDVIAAIRDGVVDAGLMRSRAVPDDLIRHGVGRQNVVALFPKGTAPDGESIESSALRGVEMIAPVAGTMVRRSFDAVVAGIDPPPRIVAESSNQEAVLELVRRGVGASLASTSASNALRIDGIDARSIRGLTIELSLVTSRWPSPAAAAFRDLAQDAMSD